MKRPTTRQVLVGVAAIVVGLVLLSLLVLRLALPELLRSRAERTLSEALKQPVSIGRARVSLLGGEVSFSRISVKGPEGFSDDDFASLRRVSLDAGFLFLQLPAVESITIERPEWNLVVRGDGARSYRAFRDILDPPEEIDSAVPVAEAPTQEPAGTPEPAPKPQREGKKRDRTIKIDRILVTDARLSIRDEFAAEEPLEISASIGSVSLHDIAVASGIGTTMSGRIENVTLRTTDRWQEPVFLSIPAIHFRIEFPADRDAGETILHEFVVEEPRLVLETNAKRTDRQRMENLNDFSHAMRNALSSDLPTRIEDDDEEDTTTMDDPTIEDPDGEDEKTDRKKRERRSAKTVVENAALRDGTIVLHTPRQDTATTTFESIGLSLENATLPHQRGDKARLEGTVRSGQLNATLTVRGEGALLAPTLMERRTLEIRGTNLPLHLLRDVRSGTLNASVDATIEQGRAVGTVLFASSKIDTERRSRGSARTIFRTIEIMSALGVGREPIPFDIPLARDDMYDTVGAVLDDVQSHSAGQNSSP